MAKFCTNCGKELEPKAYVCIHCGAKAVDNEELEEKKSRLTAGILQIVFSGFGVGRFYLGYNNIAIAQIIVTWLTCGIGALWPVIDGILILSGNVKTDAKGNLLRD